MNFDSLAMHLLPPLLVALAWRMSRVTLVHEQDDWRGWRVLGRAVAVLWLASVGPDGCACNEIAAWILLVVGLVAGLGVQRWSAQTAPPDYLVKVLYALMHGGIIASLGLFVFLAMRSAKYLP